MKIQRSAEDYLEAMLMMQEKYGFIRSIDIANHLGVTKPSVSHAVKILRENEYIFMDKEGRITLSKTGLEIATRMYERHKLLTDVLVRLGVDPAIAEDDACKIEHDLSEESFTAICRHATEKTDDKE